MKTIIAALLAFSAPAFAAQNTIYCQSNGKVLNAFSEDGHFECAGALAQGDACFTGDAVKVAAKISDRTIDWDEEWLEEATAVNADKIAYVFADGPNELRESLTMDRCTHQFFK